MNDLTSLKGEDISLHEVEVKNSKVRKITPNIITRNTIKYPTNSIKTTKYNMYSKFLFFIKTIE